MGRENFFSQSYWLSALCIFLTIPETAPTYNNIEPVKAELKPTVTLAIASSVAILMFIALIAMFVAAVTCNKWYGRYQAGKGRGKIPRIAKYWIKRDKLDKKLSKKRIKRLMNNTRAYDTVMLPLQKSERDVGTDTWIKRWANDTRQYEEKSKEINLGEELYDEVPLADVLPMTVPSAEVTISNHSDQVNSEEGGEKMNRSDNEIDVVIL